MILETSYAYHKFRTQVLRRDNHKCTKCSLPAFDPYTLKSNGLNVHHIKPKAEYPELIIDVDNAITLCKPCHINEHKRLNAIKKRVKMGDVGKVDQD